MLKGHVTLLATASYFTPVLSSLMASFLLSTPLSGPFWQGALMVCGGSLLCWISTRRQSDWPDLPENPATLSFPTSRQISGSDGMSLQM